MSQPIINEINRLVNLVDNHEDYYAVLFVHPADLKHCINYFKSSDCTGSLDIKGRKYKSKGTLYLRTCTKPNWYWDYSGCEFSEVVVNFDAFGKYDQTTFELNKTYDYKGSMWSEIEYMAARLRGSVPEGYSPRLTVF